MKEAEYQVYFGVVNFTIGLDEQNKMEFLQNGRIENTYYRKNFRGKYKHNLTKM